MSAIRTVTGMLTATTRTTAERAATPTLSGPGTSFVAHRFGRDYGPDSTAATLATALLGPIDGIETDCCLTADGRIALLHDPLLGHGTNLVGWSVDRLARDIGEAWVRDRAGALVAEHPLLLEDLWPLLEGRSLVVQLEVKAVCDEVLAVRTCEALCRSLRESPPPVGVAVEVISFWPAALPIAAEAGWDTRLIVASPYTPQALATWCGDCGITGVILEAPFWSARHVDLWRAAGLSLMSGVCNDETMARRVSTFAPDAFSTDRPHELRAALTADRLDLAAIPT